MYRLPTITQSAVTQTNGSTRVFQVTLSCGHNFERIVPFHDAKPKPGHYAHCGTCFAAELERDKARLAHDWDEEAICTKCGFDGAEWDYWRHHTYEGRASDAPLPSCGK